MRKSYPSYSLLTLSGVVFAASCSIIAEVDRTKIPQEGTPSDGGQGTGGSRGGSAGNGGSGARPTGGTAGDGGMGGEPSGGTTSGGTGGDAGGGVGGAGDGGDAGGGTAGDGGMGGMPAVCGDGNVETGEDCDDMDTMGGDGCNATCGVETGWDCGNASPSVCTEICGDRVMVGAEVCDDGNNDNCGTCRQGCRTAVTPAAATGSITPIVDSTHPVDGNTFILDDGTNAPVTFEFDSDATATGIAITFTGTSTAVEIRDAIIAAVEAQRVGGNLDIGAAAAGTAPSATLTNQRATSLGNQVIGGTNAGSYTKVDLAGGLAGDCASMVGCTPASTSSNVCASGDCNSSNLCTAP